MPTPQEIRKIRLANDYKQMCNIRGSIISWVVTEGSEPYVEEYKLTVHVRTITGVGSGGPQYRDVSEILVTLPPDYPVRPPKVVMLSSPQPFHPNWWPQKNWCYGSWSPAEALGDHVIRMVKTLQFDMDITNEYSPANSEANAWYKSKKNSGLFPCDKTRLPDPSAPNSSSAGSSFVIKRRS